MAESTLEDFGYTQEMRRSLGFWNVLAYGLIFMCPMAAMIVYGMVAQYSQGMDSLVYVIAVVGMGFTALSYGHMIREFPIAGSVFSYIQRAINPHVGFVAGWLILIDYALIPAFILSLAGLFLNMIVPAIPVWLAVAIFVAFNTVVNVCGIEWGTKMNFAILFLQLAAIAAFVVTSIFFISGGGGVGSFTLAPLWQPGKFGFDFIATALSIAVVSFLGYDAMTTLAEETEGATAVLPKAIVASLVLVGLFFVFETYLANLVHPGIEGLDPDSAFFEILTIAAGGKAWLQMWVMLTMIFALAVGVALNAQIAAARVLFCMGRDKMIPAFFGKTHSKFQTPYVATLFMGILTFILAISFSIESLVMLVNFGAMTAFMMLNVGVIWYFLIKKNNRGFASVFNYLIFPIIGFIIIGFVWYGFDPLTKIVGGIWAVLGIIYGAVKSRGYKEIPESFMELEL